ncbi:MAG: hypothetical protein KatS3mg061_2668 [Dehalococcoidia bacterium]|nr:MAG: hypothetical protein KatS3mg061_2668 [Dehalococcoidia bacterium]
MVPLAPVREKVRVRADIKCHACGFVSGEVIGSVVDGPLGPRNGRLRGEQIIPSPLCPRPWPRPGEPLRCARCGGAVYLDEIDILREAAAPEPVAARRAA